MKKHLLVLFALALVTLPVAPQAGKPEENKPTDIRIVQAPDKDPYDKAAFWINVVLAVVGTVGIGVGLGTLLFLRKQVNEMRLQRNSMDETLKAIQKQADLMKEQGERENKTLILQYRPKIIVRNAKVLNFSIELGQPWECEVRFQVVNTGGTPAYIQNYSYIQMVTAIAPEMGKTDIKWADPTQLSGVTLNPGQSMTVDETICVGANFDLKWENFNQGFKETPLRFMYFTGVIEYVDDLNTPRSTGIHRQFDPKTREFIPKEEREQEYSD